MFNACLTGASQLTGSRQHFGTICPVQIQQGNAARAATVRSSSGCKQSYTAVVKSSSRSCTSCFAHESSKSQRWSPPRALSSKSEPSSAQTSYEETSTSFTDQGDFGYMQMFASPARPLKALRYHPTSAPHVCWSIQEYAALKQQLLDNTRKSGGAVGAYLLLTVNGTAALLAMLGAGASYAYLLWLCRDVDAVQGTDLVPIWEANKIQNPWLRRAAKLSAAYRKALQPRLLVPVGLGVLIGVYNRVSGEPLPVVYSGCLLLGFLSYKIALITKLVSDLSPKPVMSEARRPKVEQVEDELDQWGRPRKRLANPIDVMPDDMQAKAYEQLEEQLAKEERRSQG